MEQNKPKVVVIPRKDGIKGWQFKCKYCNKIHTHGIGLGHRHAHCNNPESPYLETGYVLVEETEND